MDKLKSKINLFDALTAVAIIIFSIIGFYGFYFYNDSARDHDIRVTVKVASENIIEASRLDKEVYLNSVNSPVKVVNVVEKEDYSFITVQAPGRIDGQNYYFNGQRILINQRAEIHASYFAQGKIYSVEKAK